MQKIELDNANFTNAKIILGFRLEAKLVWSKHLTQVHMKISSRTHFTKLGFPPNFVFLFNYNVNLYEKIWKRDYVVNKWGEF